jgi:anti-sigma factor RsiW
MSDLSCAELVELVTAYLENGLDPAERRRFEEHLTECEGCERYLDQFRVTISALGEVAPESPPDAVRDRLLSVFRDWRRS